MILPLLFAVILVSVPLFTLFGWNTFSWGDEIQRLELRGPFNSDLILFSGLYNYEWNSSLINLYCVKLRVLRTLQFAVLFITFAYIFSGIVFVRYCAVNNINILDFVVDDVGLDPNQFSVFLGCAASIWVLGIFIRTTVASISVTMKQIENKIKDV